MSCLRPCILTLYRPLSPAPGVVYAHSFHSSNLSNVGSSEAYSNLWTMNHEVKERLEDLNRMTELYPRIVSKSRDMTCGAFNQEFKALKYTEQPTDADHVSLQGMSSALRSTF